jgi:hypothetical protein
MFQISYPLMLPRYKYCLLHVELPVPTADHNFIITHSKTVINIHPASMLRQICLESLVDATNVE